MPLRPVLLLLLLVTGATREDQLNSCRWQQRDFHLNTAMGLITLIWLDWVT
jgi:hypothetical protein